jgi:heptaprenyl diphosphate synthase
MRIGLANLPLMLALDLLNLRSFALLVLIKIVGQGIVGGTLFSYVFIFSLAGSLSSALVMYVLRRISGRRGPAAISLVGIGVAGALCSNGAQLLLARLLVFGEGIRYLAPPFLATGLITGFALGLFCEHFRSRSRWFKLHVGEAGAESPIENPIAESQMVESQAQVGKAVAYNKATQRRAARRVLRRDRWNERFNGREVLLAGLIAMLLFLLNPSTLGRALQFLLFWFCAWASGKKNNPWITLSVIAGVVLVHLLAPYGRVLAEFGPLHITQGSLIAGLRKGITLEGLFMLSGVVPGAIFGRASFGRLLGESLAVFGVIGENRRHVRPGHLIDDVDSLLLELDAAPASPVTDQSPVPAPDTAHTSAKTGRLLLALGLLLTAALTVAPGLLSIS